ncbi:hypothetical protein Trydic_g9648 [Trypoxylus dichotomus]
MWQVHHREAQQNSNGRGKRVSLESSLSASTLHARTPHIRILHETIELNYRVTLLFAKGIESVTSEIPFDLIEWHSFLWIESVQIATALDVGIPVSTAFDTSSNGIHAGDI